MRKLYESDIANIVKKVINEVTTMELPSDPDERYDIQQSMELSDVYTKFQLKDFYPNAVEAIAYFMFGDKDYDNYLASIFAGRESRSIEKAINYSEISEILMSYEHKWLVYIEDLEEELRNSMGAAAL